MNCYLHADRQAELHCAACGNLICEQCDVLLADNHVCKKCLADAESVSPQMVLERAPEGGLTNLLAHFNFGAASVSIVIGTVMGVVGAGVTRRSHELVDILGAISGAVFAAFVTYIVGALIVHLIVPSKTIQAKGGVLGLFGIRDLGAFAFFTLVVMAIAWMAMT